MTDLTPEHSLLLQLPYDILVDSIFPHLPAADLARLRLVCRQLTPLVDDDRLWRANIQRDFNFPLHASNRQSGWQTLYRGLHKPAVFIWGQSDNARLGISPQQLTPHLAQFISRYRGSPFPLKLSYSREAAEAGPPVEIVAGGWSFHCLTAKGEVLYHGQLDGDDFSRGVTDKGCLVPSPKVLSRATEHPVTSLSCGRAHGIALTSQQDILEWQTWNMAVKHERLIQLASSTPTWIEQLEAGWNSTAVLLHSRETIGAKRSSQIIWWYTHELRPDRLVVEGLNERTSTWVGIPRSTLPLLPRLSPEVAAELQEQDADEHGLITRIAAGESWLVALTASGLIYKIDLQPQRSARRSEWVLLDNFCLPSRIAQLGYFSRKENYSARVDGTKLKITHINAQFRNFATYTPSTSTDGGIVLLGNQDSTEGSEPLVKPELQSAGVIKVSMGDWHFGALTISGKVMTWGSWSNGALGTWDSLPLVTSAGRNQDTPPHPPLARRGRGPAPTPVRPIFRVGSTLPTMDRNPLRGRGRLGLAAARGGFRNGVRTMDNPAPRTEPRSIESDDEDNVDDEMESEYSIETSNHDGSNGAGPSSIPITGDPWTDRLKPRVIPQRAVEQPTIVQFDPARQDKDFVFDIAFAGWHSAAISIPTGLVRGTGSSESEGEQEIGKAESSTSSTLTIEQFQSGSPTLPSRSRSTSSGSPFSLLFPSSQTPIRQRHLNDDTASLPLDLQAEVIQRSHQAERYARQIQLLSLVFLAYGLFTFLGGWEYIFPLTLISHAADDRANTEGEILVWPHSLLNFVPLFIPLTLYFVIARWTGRQLYSGFAS